MEQCPDLGQFAQEGIQFQSPSLNLYFRKISFASAYLRVIGKASPFFIRKLRNIVEEEKEIKDNPSDLKVLREAKKVGFSDKVIAQFWNMP